ncbi:MAG: CPBP family intramembrane metalloprotease [Streptococcaceae bacterium]|jgi:membrane protease YdiL (CAAX protease family)|nr:CPBP family intramembrane metalloprotease [Streptococcaceae bacterium]
MLEKLKSFEIPYSMQFIKFFMILGAYEIANDLPLETWFFSFARVGLRPFADVYPFPVLLLDITLLLIFVAMLTVSFQLKLFESKFTKQYFFSIVFGLLGCTLVIAFQHYFGSPIDNLQIYYSDFSYLLFTSIVFAPSLLNELIFRGLFFKFYLKDDSIRNRILIIFLSGVFQPTLMFATQELPLIDWFAPCLLGWVCALTYYYSKDIKIPIVFHILINAFIYL